MACETLGEGRKPLSYGYYPTSLAQCPHNYAMARHRISRSLRCQHPIMHLCDRALPEDTQEERR